MIIDLNKVKKHKVYKEKNEIYNKIKELFDFLKNNYKKENRLFISNHIVKEKILLRKAYKQIGDLKFEIRQLERQNALYFIKKKAVVKNKAKIRELNNIISKIRDLLLSHAAILLDVYFPLLNDYFTEGEIIQVISGNFESVKEIKNNPSICYFEKEHVALSYIMNNIEFRHKKENWINGIYDEYEMPLFNCINNYI